jgi:hypothetical protein
LRRTVFGIAFVPVFIVGVVVGVLARPSSAPEGVPVAPPATEPAPPSTKPTPEPAGASTKPEAKLTPAPAVEAAPQDGFGLAPALAPMMKHYGKVLEGQARTHVFKIERPDGAALKIGRTYSPCPCVYVTAKKRAFGRGAQADVEIMIHSLTLNGKQSFPAYVELLEPEKKVLRADVTIEVERVPAKLMLKPDAIHLGAVRCTGRGTKSASVELHNLTKRPVTVGDVSCSVAGVAVSMPDGKRIAPGGFVTIAIETPDTNLDVGLPRGPIRGEVRIGTNVPEHAVLAIPIDGTSLGGP